MEADIRNLLEAAARSPEGRARVLRQLSARQGEAELMVELLGRIVRPARLSSDGVATLRAVEGRPEVQVWKAALMRGGLVGAGDPAVVEAWAAGHQDLLQELKERWAQLSPQQRAVVSQIELLIAALALVRDANQHPGDLGPVEDALLARINRELAEIWELVRRALLELIAELV